MSVSTVCHACGIPVDAGFFDDSNIVEMPDRGQEAMLARYQLHRNYCGVLMYFSQYTDQHAMDGFQVKTPGLHWQIRCNGQPRAPYLGFDHIVNPWGMAGFPLYVRLEAGSVVELVVRNVGSRANVRKAIDFAETQGFNATVSSRPGPIDPPTNGRCTARIGKCVRQDPGFNSKATCWLVIIGDLRTALADTPFPIEILKELVRSAA